MNIQLMTVIERGRLFIHRDQSAGAAGYVASGSVVSPRLDDRQEP
jgi:hypothetical protein